MATAVSSALYPSAPATGATYLNVSPSRDTLVFAFDEAAAIISAKSPALSAPSPNAVNASVTMSDVKARFSPDAAARFIIPSMPRSISSVFQPAIAMYVKASPASVAENFVFCPISLALFVRSLKSLPVAPEIADTSDIVDSNDIPAPAIYPPNSLSFPPAA